MLPGHGLDGARHGGRLEGGRSVGVQAVAEGVDGGEGPWGGQGESVLVLRLRHHGLEQGIGGWSGAGRGHVFGGGAPHALLATLGRH